MLKQRSKVDWLKLGDSNNKYFYASLKSKQNQSNISSMTMEYANILTKPEEFESEIMRFYSNLVGSTATNLQGIC